MTWLFFFFIIIMNYGANGAGLFVVRLHKVMPIKPAFGRMRTIRVCIMVPHRLDAIRFE